MDPNVSPLAPAHNTFVFDKARFRFLTHKLVRMEWNENAAFEDRATPAAVNRNFPKVDFSIGYPEIPKPSRPRLRR